MKTIAEHMKDILIEGGRTVVWYGDIDEIHECAGRSGLTRRMKSAKCQHPMMVINKVLNALDRSPLFEKGYIKHIGRPARAYTLKQVP